MSEYSPVEHGVKPIADDLETFVHMDGIQVIDRCLAGFPDTLTATLTRTASTHSFVRYESGGGASFDQSRDRFDLLVEWLMFNHRGDAATELRSRYSELHQILFDWERDARERLKSVDPEKINAPNFRGNIEWLLGSDMHRLFCSIQGEGIELLKWLRHLEVALTAATSDIIDSHTAMKMLDTKSNASFQRWRRQANVEPVGHGKWKRDDIERIKSMRETLGG
ncbi:MAG: hypothetical protein F9B45_28585 [Phycisphaera sp. RhM]|nr:hypothetical protein [Phycisphaera sp. RhM]